MLTAIFSSSSARARTTRGIGARFAGPVISVLFLLGMALLLHHDGVHSTYLLRYVAYVLLGLALPGFVVQRSLIGPARTWFSEIVLALTVGVVLELIAWALFVGCGLGSFLWAWPLVTIPLLLVKHTRKRILSRPREHMTLGVILAISAGLASLMWMCHRQALSANPLPGRGGGIYQDLLWHMGLVYEARRSFPLKTPQVIDAGTLHYHWYSDAHMAAASLIAHVPVPVEELRFFPALFFFLGFGMTVVVVGEVVRRASAMGVAAVLAAATTTFSPFPQMYVNFGSYIADSPSQLFAVPLTLAFLFSVYRFVQESLEHGLRHRRTCAAGVLVLLLLIGLSGAKASAPPSVLGGVGLLWLWSLTVRKARAATTGLLGLCLVGTWVALSVVVGGDAGSGKQLFAPLGAAPVYRALLHPKGGIGWALPGAILPGFGSHLVLSIGLLGFSVLSAICMWLSLGMGVTRQGRREPFTWLINGTLVASMFAYYVINHPGLSEFYFMSGALSAGIVGVVYQGSLWWDRASARARTTAVVASGFALVAALADLVLKYPKRSVKTEALFQLRISVIVLFVIVIGVVLIARFTKVSVLALTAALAVGATAAETVYQPLFTGKTKVHATTANRLTQGAGMWVESHVPSDALLATNQHCRFKEALVCPSNEWWLSGIGGHRVLIEGWSYTPKSANREPFFEPGLLAVNQKVFTKADSAAVQILKKRGVQYLVAVKGATKLSPNLASVGNVVYANAKVKIYQLK